MTQSKSFHLEKSKKANFWEIKNAPFSAAFLYLLPIQYLILYLVGKYEINGFIGYGIMILTMAGYTGYAAKLRGRSIFWGTLLLPGLIIISLIKNLKE